MNYLRAAICAALFLAWQGGHAKAEDISLIARDGSITLSGNLIGYDGEFYRIETEYGILTVDGSGVRCEGPGCPNLGAYVADLVISGAHELGAILMPALVEGFALRQGYALKREEQQAGRVQYTLYEGDAGQKAAQITIQLGSSNEGFADLLGHKADIVLSQREVNSRERVMAYEAGLGDLNSRRQERVLALNGLVPVVSPGNPVRRLSMSQLAAIYAGKITSWQELGGEDAPITPYLQAEGTGFAPIFEKKVISAQGTRLSDRVVRVQSDAALLDAVVRDPFGLGIAPYTRQGNNEIVQLSGRCGFGVDATELAIKAEDYPLTTPIYLYLPELRLPQLGRELLTYLRSEAAQLVTRRAGYVDQAMSVVPLSHQGDRLANAIAMAGDEITLEELQRLSRFVTRQSRLSLTFRFEGGSTYLDAPSRSNVTLLARALEAGRFDGRKMSFVGFSDGQGAAAQNLNLSRKRADAVRQAVLAEAEGLDTTRVALGVEAFGEALPMACDESAWGRGVNRRVEIWLD
ncbi:phosphate ABC transporter substrate-binding/OmpA family protein [Aliiroseovarius sp. KMU-50]|uniref:Phosphate ABC transporter substrate-binding/OmpA family protein n=1 Tax=Aliiroseovarius salicola TaxID=3009082 RepID=A0ABT4VZ70_9RHOB|nr:phosphate ABC transporter substrate-binding/OmpA family protein [Aliiroseovarius sp. KMU-50]MDA5093025.1 phosphate ABC transporter substrate-binding/OmpA family protein [Aliiroseovarius sp. KMU-50]